MKVLESIVKHCLSLREYVQCEHLDLFRMIPLDIEPRDGLHQFCDFPMEVCETRVGNYLSLALVNVVIDFEEFVVEVCMISKSARVVSSEVLLVLSLEPLYGLVLFCYAHVIEVVGVFLFLQIIQVENRDRAIGNLLTFLSSYVYSLLNPIIVYDSDVTVS